MEKPLVLCISTLQKGKRKDLISGIRSPRLKTSEVAQEVRVEKQWRMQVVPNTSRLVNSLKQNKESSEKKNVFSKKKESTRIWLKTKDWRPWPFLKFDG